MVFQRLAAVRIAGAGIEIVGPVAPHPGDDEFAVDRLLPAEHQIDFERLVEEAGHVAVRFEHLLEPVNQPRAEHPLERER